MAESKTSKRKQKQTKNTEQQPLRSSKDELDANDNVFEENPQEQQKLLQTTTPKQSELVEIMSSNPSRPPSKASSSTNQNSPSVNKKPTPTSETSIPVPRKASTSEVSEINERPASMTGKSTNSGSPANIPPKPQLTKAERRAIQEAQRAAKEQKKAGTPAAKPAVKPKENQTQSTAPKKAAPDQTTISSSHTTPSATLRPQSEAGDSVISTATRSTRTAPAASNPASNVSGNQSRQQRPAKRATDERVTLFSHLSINTRDLDRLILKDDSKLVHPAILKLGLQYATRQISGSNLRCIAFLVAIQKMLEDYQGPPGSTDSSILNPVDLNTKIKLNINFLTKCRPNAVTMGTAIRFLKTHIERIPRNITNENAKKLLSDVIRDFIHEKIELAGIAIADTYATTKITNGDVILIFGYSSLITRILEKAVNNNIDFRVIIVDSRPQQTGLRTARKLLSLNIKCTYVLINAVPFIISEVTKVLLGAHGLLANGYVMSQVGTAQISLIAKTHNVPVLVCCETYKFCERVQTDSFVFNELGDPNDLMIDHPILREALSPSSSTGSLNSNLNILNMTYDVTPPTFISAVITELGILPCTSVAVVIRMQNKQLDELFAQDQLSTATTNSTTTNSLNTVLEPIQ